MKLYLQCNKIGQDLDFRQVLVHVFKLLIFYSFNKKDYVQPSMKECYFYIDHSGIVKDFMAKVLEGLAKRKREKGQNQGWFELRFSTSPWLTSLISTLLGPLIIILLLLTFDFVS